MPRSARSRDFHHEPDGFVGRGAAAVGGAIVRNPALVGGMTAFLVALSYVSANALWYQPHFHAGAFFATRDRVEIGPRYDRAPAPPAGETTIRIERPEKPVAARTADPDVERMQSILHDLGFYKGAVDGLTGPATRSAVVAYQKTVGLDQTGEIDAALLEHLGARTTTAGIAPRPAPAPRGERAEAAPRAAVPVVLPSEPPAPGAAAARTARESDPRVVRIQAGLKAFGNDGIELDGVVGSRTRAAIKEFQSLFGLPVTGEPDEALYAKMRETGLTN
ncbi:MAG: peptidoglycan-binding protein [Rhizobiaceae bacterium]|nr:MAG: peptidoglycan-binding protein [Rhizobiaceae bacterium]CAG0994853.1 Localization factor PodJL [Rhizobiaceae bacterium]